MELLWRLKTNISLSKARKVVKFSKPQVIFALAHSPSKSSKSRAASKGKEKHLTGKARASPGKAQAPSTKRSTQDTPEVVTKLSQESR